MGTGRASDYSKEVAKGSFWGLAGSITFNLVSFFYIILVARAVSQDDLGLFYLALSVVSVVAVFEGLGMGGSLSRYVPFFEGQGQKGKIKTLLKSSYAIVTVSSLFFMAIVWLAADTIGGIYQNPMLPEAIRLLSIFLPLSILFKVNKAYLRGRSDIKTMELLKNFQNALKLILTFAFFQVYGASVFTLSLGYLLSFLLGTLAAFLAVSLRSKDLPAEDVSISTHQLLRDILPFGLMLTLMSSIGVLLFSTDRIILAYLVDPAEATAIIAVYSISASLALVTMIFPNSIGAIFLPLMSKLYGKNNLEDMRSVAETAQRWSLFMTVPVATVMIAFSREMLTIFYGEAYAGGSIVLSLFVLGVIIKSISSVLSLSLSAMRVVRLQLKILLIGGMANLIVNILLIPVIGMPGAAVAFLVSTIVFAYLLRGHARRLFGFHFSPRFTKLLAAAAVTIIIALLIKPFFIIAAISMPDVGDSLFELYLSKLYYLTFLGMLAGLSFIMFMLLVLALRCFGSQDVAIMEKAMAKARVPEGLIRLMVRITSYGVAK
jgi:O-antigen/teichoic acid export membrane protein